ncbi:MAG TPA: Ppx/GppA phosphatase family protein [Phycisphaerales bacterium]|nr:Ppx/GppA phosphatase family protein [Phycisphaerales bacterium]
MSSSQPTPPAAQLLEPKAVLASLGSLAANPSALTGQRLAVIDIGSNSIRLLVVELLDSTLWKVLHEERAMTRLAHGLSETGAIAPDSLARSIEAVVRFKSLADKHGATARAFATAAVRDASNRADFTSLVKDRTGMTVEVISGLDEGKHTYRAVARSLDLSHGLCAVVDIGGGSMEVVFSIDGVITESTTMPLGAVRLTEAFGGPELAAADNFSKMKRHVKRTIAHTVREHATPPAMLVGCGGTFNTLATLAAASRGVVLSRNSPALRDLAPISREQLVALIDQLRAVPLAERLRTPGLPSDRADIIIAGLLAVERLMKHTGATRIHCFSGGVREGLLLRMIRDISTDAQPASDAATLLREVRAFASQARYERAHSEHVATLALSLYDQFLAQSDLIPKLGTEPMERELLGCAAVLHDVGILVDYDKHHKHSATMIRHAEFTSLTPRHQELVAQIARYHRKAMPDAKHAAFAVLPARDQQVISRLAAILRVADGLDRTHGQIVTQAAVRFTRGAVRIEAHATIDASDELRAATKKSDLLARVIRMPVEIVALPASAS